MQSFDLSFCPTPSVRHTNSPQSPFKEFRFDHNHPTQRISASLQTWCCFKQPTGLCRQAPGEQGDEEVDEGWQQQSIQQQQADGQGDHGGTSAGRHCPSTRGHQPVWAHGSNVPPFPLWEVGRPTLQVQQAATHGSKMYNQVMLHPEPSSIIPLATSNCLTNPNMDCIKLYCYVQHILMLL